MSAKLNNDISAQLLAGLRARIENKIIEAKARYRDGDREWFGLNRETAGRHYRAALVIYAQVTDLRKQADELRDDWQVDEEDIDVMTRWQVVPGLSHRGVGEGDSGLDEDDDEGHAALEDARRAAMRSNDATETIPPDVLATYYAKHPPLVPCCDPCKEPDCAVAGDGTCAQIRRYLASDRRQHPAECNAINPHNPGFFGPDGVAAS